MQEKKKDIWLSPMTKTPVPIENSKTNAQHTNATENIDYTTIADRLRMGTLSNISDLTCVVKPVYGYPTFPLTAKPCNRVIKRTHKHQRQPLVVYCIPIFNYAGTCIAMKYLKCLKFWTEICGYRHIPVKHYSFRIIHYW